MRRTNITLVLTLLAIGFMQGQGKSNLWKYGELFLKNGVSKKGFIMYKLHSKTLSFGSGDKNILFKTELKDKKEKYPESKVDYFVVESGKFTYVPVSRNKRSLFRVVIDGRATLYHRYYSSGSADATKLPNYDEEYFVLVKGESFAKLYLADNVLSVRKKALKYFSDCPSLVQKLKNKTYGRRHYQTIVSDYNKCHRSK